MAELYTASLLGAPFDWERFMPHGQCYKWEPGVPWSHALSDLLIATEFLCGVKGQKKHQAAFCTGR